MKKIKYYLGFILAFLFIALSFTIKAQSTTKSFTSTLPFGNTDNLQIYNAVRLSGGGGGTQSVVITNTNYATSNLQGQINQNITNVRTKLDTTNQYLRQLTKIGDIVNFNYTITTNVNTTYLQGRGIIGNANPLSFSLNLGSGYYELEHINIIDISDPDYYNSVSSSKQIIFLSDSVTYSDNQYLVSPTFFNEKRTATFLNSYSFYGLSDYPLGAFYQLFTSGVGTFSTPQANQYGLNYKNYAYTNKLYFVLSSGSYELAPTTNEIVLNTPNKIIVRMQFKRIN